MTGTDDRRTWVEQIMGMPISVHLRGPELRSQDVERAVAAVFGQLREVERLFSTYRHDSQVSAMNRGELSPDRYHPLLTEVVALCEQARERTDGYFDADLPLPGGGTRFDPAGLVKGWAVERAAGTLRGLAGRDFCLNAGGDIVVGGAGAWRIGIENPVATHQLLTIVTMAEGAVATSGLAHRGTHVVVPHTGAAAVDLLAATVIGQSLTWADVYATAAIARGRTSLRWLGKLSGYAGMIVRSGGAVLVTADWPGIDDQVTTIRSKPGAQPSGLDSSTVFAPALRSTETLIEPTLFEPPDDGNISSVAAPPLTLRYAVRRSPQT